MVALEVNHTPKMIKEAIAVAESALRLTPSQRKVLADIIRECDRHRPIGTDGKHGDLHTDTCGCLDKPVRVRNVFRCSVGGVHHFTRVKWGWFRRRSMCVRCGEVYR